MSEQVVITGIGCVSCFGMGHRALIDAIGSGSSGIAPITRFDTADCRSRSAATIRHFDPAAFISPLKLRRVDAVGRGALARTRLAAVMAERAGGIVLVSHDRALLEDAVTEIAELDRRTGQARHYRGGWDA